jgi:aryl-alcohol dehydrogenase-like predicted oxidoreductase
MEYTTLGRTDLKVSVAGLGCGGPSRLGRRAGASQKQAIDLIHHAIDLGINFFDTAHVYGTEEVLGAALASVPRDSVIVSTKYAAVGVSAEQIVARLDDSLRALETDYVDVFHLHGVKPKDYDHALKILAPALLRERERGKIRFLGITESLTLDPEQTVLQRALDDGCWDVIMILFNMMHQGAHTSVVARSNERNIGTLIMSAVRSLFSSPVLLTQTIKELVAAGRVPATLGETNDPLGFLVHERGADSVIDAAYRFARHAPGADVVLFGTGSSAHMEANISSLLKPPLPKADLDRLADLFGHLRDVGMRESI